MSADTPAPALKEMFNAARYRQLADLIQGVFPAIDRRVFLDYVLDGIETRSLLQRLRRTSEGLRLVLPKDYTKALAVLDALAPKIGHNFVAIVLPDFVALYGRDAKDRKRSLAALSYYTQFGSSEFAIREFLRDELHTTLAAMHRWAEDSNEHVRRLSSEGSRPRLPWSFQIAEILRSPDLTAPILEKLLRDESLYVRKSVANHLNDRSKDHPEWLIAFLSKQDLAHPHTQWIAKRALRTLVKRGHPGALQLLGAGEKPKVQKARLILSPKKLVLGQKVELAFSFLCSARKPQKLVIDVAFHFVKASGASSAKVFKWKEITAEPGTEYSFLKTQRLQNFTTRKHYSGRHQVDVMINGVLVATDAFQLTV